MENRSAFLLLGNLFIVAGFLFVPLLCGVGFLFPIVGAMV